MPKQILWSPLSVGDFENTLSYLNSNWNNQVAVRYINEVESLITSISKQPKQFPLINQKNKVRKCVITKHNTLYYRETKVSIEILRIFDTRQNPAKLKLK